MEQDDKHAAMAFGRKLIKNPDICLVYDLVGRHGVPLTRDDLQANEKSAGIELQLEALANEDGIKICADGDSWIEILIEFSHLFGYHRTFFDVLEERYRTATTAWPGDTFEKMLQEKTYTQHIDSGIFDFFIFSGGGNDVLGGGALTGLLKSKNDGGGSSDPADYLKLDRIDDALKKLRSGYMDIAQYVKVKSPKTVMLVHGYDYPLAQPDGPWLGSPFQKRNFDITHDKALINSILAYLVDRFYSLLEDVARANSNVILVDIRGVVNGRWADELHPKREASRDIADIYQEIMERSRVA